MQVIVPTPHVSLGEFIAIENERMIPQQAASMLTNVDDIESYIRSKESDTQRYLWAIGSFLSRNAERGPRAWVYQDHAGYLFPGLDGACEELKERYFEI